MAQVSAIELTDGTKRGIRAGAIPYGIVDSTSTATAFTATVPGVTELTDGTCVLLKNGVVTSAANFTININGLGAKHAYSNMAAATAETTIFNINYTMLFVYDSTRVSGGGWILYRGYNSNDNTIGYQLRTNSTKLTASDKGYRYRLWFTSPDGTKWVPANLSTSTNATTARTLNTRPINPFGPIIYYSSNATTNAGAQIATTTQWEQYTLTIGYSYVITLVDNKAVYLQCTPQADGSAVMNTITQTLPTTEDGKIYIFLGFAYSTTQMELRPYHPVYYYKEGALRLWTNAPTSSTGQAQANWNETDTTSAAYIQNKPTNVSAFTNDAGYYSSGSNLSFALIENTRAEIYEMTVSGSTVSFAGNTLTMLLVLQSAMKVLFYYIDQTGGIHFFTLTKAQILAASGGFPSEISYTINGITNGIEETIELIQDPDDDNTVIGTLTTRSTIVPTATSDLTNDSGFISVNDIYPVGSVHITATNSNPSSIYGGTWTLIDKEFTTTTAQQISCGTSEENDFVINTTNTTSTSAWVSRQGHSIFLSINPITFKVAVSGTNLTLGTFKLPYLGAQAAAVSPTFTAISDGTHALVFMNINRSTGVLQSQDVVVRGTATSIAAGSTATFTIELPCDYTDMVNSFCNKFYWRRTA